jgi:RND superfamily putative drug exporter
MPRTRPAATGGSGLLGRVADAAFVHRRRVLLGWLATLVLAVAAVAAFGGRYTADYGTPGSDSQAAAERLADRFAGRSGDQVDLVWRTTGQSARAPEVTARIDRLLDETERLEGVVPGARAADAELSSDGRTAVARIALDRPSSAVPAATGEHLRELVADARQEGLTVAANGSLAGLKAEASMNAEMVGIAVAALVLLLTFGSVVAAGLPLLTALLGVAVAALFGGVLAALLDTPDWALQVSLMIGIGVGIDYALLIVTRHRAALAAGRSPRAANVEAMTTAGRSVLTAGATVVVSLLGLFLMRLPYLYGVALSASLAVLVVLAASVTLLPALLGAAGDRVTRLRIPRAGRPPADPDRTPSARHARAVTRRPLLATVAALLLLTVLTAPVTGLRFGFPDAGNDPATATTRQAYDLIADGFGPGANGPLIAVAAADGPDRARAGSAVDRLAADIARQPGVAAVAPALWNESGDTAIVTVIPAGSPESPATKRLVERLRDGALADAGLPVRLGGQTAASVDQSDVTANRLPLFIGGVVALSFLLLLAAFRAPLIAAKAALSTVLSIAAAYGVVALVAEGGTVGRLVGIDTDLPVPPFIPVMMFAVLFGLAMDYEVFLLERIREERTRLGDAGAAVTTGVARTARVIVAAAAIMVSVFGAFALSPDVMLKLIGIGLAAAILIDALLVRLLLVPALMRLLGERAWWRPGRAAQAAAERPAPEPATAA